MISFSLPFVPVFVIAFTLLLSKAQGEDMKFCYTLTKYTLVLYCLAMGWCYFFNPLGTVFECDKATNRCEYKQRTIYRPALYSVQAFNLNDLNHIEIQKKRALEKIKKKIKFTFYYKIVFHIGSDEINYPKDFDYLGEAEITVDRLNDFLNTNEQKYTFKDGYFKPKESDKAIKYCFFTSILYVFLWFAGEYFIKRRKRL